MSQKQIHVYFIGEVQGVGFRYTVERFAQDLGIKGWVKNLRGGKVELVAEGDESILKDFLSRINHYFTQYIRDIEINWSDASGEFKDFGIKF